MWPTVRTIRRTVAEMNAHVQTRAAFTRMSYALVTVREWTFKLVIAFGGREAGASGRQRRTAQGQMSNAARITTLPLQNLGTVIRDWENNMPDFQHLIAYALMGVGGLGLLGSYGGSLGSWLWSKLPSTKNSVDEDVLDFQALSRVHKRFERIGCKEGLAASTLCLQHFWHTEDHKDE